MFLIFLFFIINKSLAQFDGPIGLSPNFTQNNEFQSACYMTNWAIYRQEQGNYKPSFKPENVNTSLCTNVIYAFMNLNDKYEVVLTDSWADIDLKMIQNTVALLGKGKVKTVSFAIGGWKDSLVNRGLWLKLLKNESDAEVATLAGNLIKFMNKYGFNGVDFDYEFPVCVNNMCNEKYRYEAETYIYMLNTINKLLKLYNPIYKVSFAMNINDKLFALDKLSPDITIHLMSYDLYGFDNFIGHNAPKTSNKFNNMLSVEEAIKSILKHSINPRQLLVGFPSYGRGFLPKDKIVVENQFGKISVGKSSPFKYTQEAGIASLFELCVEIKNETPFYAETEGSYIKFNNYLISFSDIKDAIIIRNMILQYHLGGSMIYTLDFDDFNGYHCKVGCYPLLSALNGIQTNFKTVF